VIKGLAATSHRNRPLTRSRQNIANLYMGPFSATRSFDVALVELGSDGVVANATPLKRPNDRQHVYCELLGRAFQGLYGFAAAVYGRDGCDGASSSRGSGPTSVNVLRFFAVVGRVRVKSAVHLR